MRTLRSKRLRRLLARAFNWRCGICNEPLPDEWHADHIEPWSVTHRTNVFEMQPTCPGCNLSKGAKTEASQMKNVNPSWSSSRPGIAGAVSTAVQRRMAGEKSCTIVLPTRYGKTDVARLIGCILHSRGLAPYVITISPAVVLMKNVASKKKWVKALRRYGIPTNTMAVRSIRNIPRPDRLDVAANFLSVTIQMLQSQSNDLAAWVSAIERRHGERPVFIFDECHMMGAPNEWGKVVQSLMDLGCYVVLMSATPFRSDGLEIPGATYRETNREDYVRPVCTDGSSEDRILVSVYEGTYSHREMIPDFQLRFHEAWEEPSLPMCHIGLNRIRVDVAELTSGKYDTLEQLPETLCRQVLSKCVRDPRVIAASVKRMVQTLSQIKRDVPEAQAMVFIAGRSSDDTEDDQHHRMVMKELERQCPRNWRIVSATQDTEDANDTIISFCGNHDGKKPLLGVGDVLILKNMGSLGIDAPQCKVVVDLSPTRTLGSWIQRIMRGGTRYLNFEIFELITLSDVLVAANLSWLTKGGAVGLKIRENEELINSYETQKREKEPGAVWHVSAVDQGDFVDTKGNAAEATLARQVDAMIEQIPSLSLHCSRAELGAALSKVSMVAENDDSDDSVDDDIDAIVTRKSKEAQDLAKGIVLQTFTYKPERQHEFRERIRSVMKRAKVSSGCDLGVDTKQYTPSQLDSLIVTLRAMKGERGARAS